MRGVERGFGFFKRVLQLTENREIQASVCYRFARSLNKFFGAGAGSHEGPQNLTVSVQFTRTAQGCERDERLVWLTASTLLLFEIKRYPYFGAFPPLARRANLRCADGASPKK